MSSSSLVLEDAIRGRALEFRRARRTWGAVRPFAREWPRVGLHSIEEPTRGQRTEAPPGSGFATVVVVEIEDSLIESDSLVQELHETLEVDLGMRVDVDEHELTFTGDPDDADAYLLVLPDEVSMHTRPGPGTILGGKYRLGRTLGRGGSGRVFEATDLRMERTVAIKVLRYDIEPSMRRQHEWRFLREARRAGGLRHPNIVTIHDFDHQEDGTCYIVMERVQGVSLNRLLADGPLEPARALIIVEQVVRGLREAHRAGLVHRDIKPGNILVSPGDSGIESVTLVDFGLVRGQTDEDVTEDGVFLGTPNYVAPEQARSSCTDSRSDLYSVGVVMYLCLTGTLPHGSKDPVQALVAKIRDPYPPMADQEGDHEVPSELEQIVRRCMQRDPDDRYQSAEDLLADIRWVYMCLYNADLCWTTENPIPSLGGLVPVELVAGGRADHLARSRRKGSPARRALRLFLFAVGIGVMSASLAPWLIPILAYQEAAAMPPDAEAPGLETALSVTPRWTTSDGEEASQYPVRTEHRASRPEASSGSAFLFSRTTSEAAPRVEVEAPPPSEDKPKKRGSRRSRRKRSDKREQ